VSVPNPLWLIPNMITLARLLAVPVTIYLILQSQYQPAFWLFVAAGISDAVDGFLAKRLNVVSEIGEYLDPLADKALLVGIYVTLGQTDHLVTWLVILVVFRDVLIIGGAILFQTLTQSLKMDPLYISKVNTTAQIALAAVVLGELGFDVALGFVSEALVYIVAATTLLSGAAYVIKWGRLAITMEQDQ
jgi:cardiolipin synthase